MMRTMWPSMTVLALLAGIAGCFPYRDWRGNSYGREDRDPHYVDTNSDQLGGDCLSQGGDWSCLRGRTEHASIFAW